MSQPLDTAFKDGCTLSPDTLLGIDLRRLCCDAHDRGYRTCETAGQRLDLDRAFRRCIAARTRMLETRWKVGVGWLYAWVAYAFVRVFGHPAIGYWTWRVVRLARPGQPPWFVGAGEAARVPGYPGRGGAAPD